MLVCLSEPCLESTCVVSYLFWNSLILTIWQHCRSKATFAGNVAVLHQYGPHSVNVISGAFSLRCWWLWAPGDSIAIAPWSCFWMAVAFWRFGLVFQAAPKLGPSVVPLLRCSNGSWLVWHSSRHAKTLCRIGVGQEVDVGGPSNMLERW